jgi:hypothetical protein
MPIDLHCTRGKRMRFMTTIRPALIIAVFLASTLSSAMITQPADAQVAPAPQLHRIYGVLVGVDLANNQISFQKRNGKVILLDISQAVALQQVGVLPLNKPIAVWGVRGPDKLFHVQSIGHASPNVRNWGDDNDTGQ